jgi:hypothetical protein
MDTKAGDETNISRRDAETQRKKRVLDRIYRMNRIREREENCVETVFLEGIFGMSIKGNILESSSGILF